MGVLSEKNATFKYSEERCFVRGKKGGSSLNVFFLPWYMFLLVSGCDFSVWMMIGFPI